MKKFVAILLALVLVTTCVACTNGMTSGEFKTEFEKFDWENSMPTAINFEAERLLGILEEMPADTQKELADIKAKLEEYKMTAGGTEEEDKMTEDKKEEDKMPEDLDENEIMPEEGGIIDDMKPEEGGIIDEMMPEGDLKDDIMQRGMKRPDDFDKKMRMNEIIGRKHAPKAPKVPKATEMPEASEMPKA